MARLKAYIWISASYVLGCTAGWFLFIWITPNANDIYNVLLGLFLADLCATVIVWVFGVIFKNSSFYDPYWSLIPLLMVFGLVCRFSLWSTASILFIAVFGIWSWRLTANWAYTCKNIRTEDWRYQKYRAENKMLFWHVINFFGINLMPTLVVFAALIPGIILVLSTTSLGAFQILGAAIILTGTALETAADISMHKFLKTAHPTSADTPRSVNKNGLWNYSRHPNYFGEILIWIGVYLSALPYAAWWFGGMAAVILLFCCVSIPLAEKRHNARRPDYAEYKKTTSMLIPLPKFRK